MSRNVRTHASFLHNNLLEVLSTRFVHRIPTTDTELHCLLIRPVPSRTPSSRSHVLVSLLSLSLVQENKYNILYLDAKIKRPINDETINDEDSNHPLTSNLDPAAFFAVLRFGVAQTRPPKCGENDCPRSACRSFGFLSFLERRCRGASISPHLGRRPEGWYQILVYDHQVCDRSGASCVQSHL